MGNKNRFILSLFGSPRQESFSSRIHSAFLTPFEQADISIKKISVHKKEIKPCIACGYCRDRWGCIHNDDMTELYDLIKEAGAVSVSSPVYFSGLPGPLKNLIDRCQVLWEAKRRDEALFNEEFGQKKGFFISSGGSEYKNMFKAPIIVLRHFFNTINTSFDEKDYIFIQNTDTLNKPPQSIVSLAQNRGDAYKDILL
ncbi:MAG: flavodoxin family protein [bacterium]|nr:flavodoxin family protein [bacterium]